MIQTGQRPNLSHEDAAREPEPTEVHNFHHNINLTDLNQEDDAKEADQHMEAYLKSQYKKRTFINPQTGRKNQRLFCLQCRHSSQQLGNMKNHLRCHLQLRRFKCSIC